MPDAPKDILIRALQLDSQNDLAGAAQACKELLALNPRLPQALCLLGRIFRRQRNYYAARQYLQQAQSLTPDAYQLLAEFGTLELEERRPLAAIDYFQRALAANPDRPEAEYNLAKGYELAGEYDTALQHLQSALDLGIGNPHEVYTDIGSMHVMSDRLDEAQQAFEQALTINADETPALFGLGTIQAARGDFEGALETYRQCIDKNPDFAPAYRHLAEEKRFEDGDDADFRLMQKALDSGQTSPLTEEKLHFALGKANDDLGKHDAAFHHYAAANQLKRVRLPPFDRDSLRLHVDRIISQFESGLPAGWPEHLDHTPMPICVLGMPRSGTTLVERILARHPQVTAGGELGLVDRIARTLLESYQRPLQQVSDDEWREAREQYLSRLGRDAQTPFVTDKTIGNYAHIGLVKMLCPGARVVLCQREPLDMILSNFFQDFALDRYPANDLDELAFFTQQYRRLIDHWQRVLPETLLAVEYELLVDDPEVQVRKILQHCGLPWDPACLEFQAADGSIATLSRWQARQPLYRSSAGRWSHYRQHIGTLLEQFGEPGSRPISD